jgi:hypothetical protein
MATSSIFNSVHIKDAASCREFLNAVESSEKAVGKRVPLLIKVKELTDPKEVSDLFKAKK